MQNHDTPNDNLIPYGYCHCGCGQKTAIANRSYTARGIKKGRPLRYIKGHNTRLIRKNRPLPIWVTASTAAIPLVGKMGEGKFALVDNRDVLTVSQYRWALNKSGYAFTSVTGVRGKLIKMHRLVSKAPEGMLVDHKNHNPIDNRSSNLRVCTHVQNSQNARAVKGSSSQYKGVTWDKSRNKWQAAIGCGGVNINLGRFDTEDEAARAYDVKAKEIQGEFALANFPREVETYS